MAFQHPIPVPTHRPGADPSRSAASAPAARDAATALPPRLADAIRRLERDADHPRGWLAARGGASGAAIRHAERLAEDAAAAGQATMACLSSALARSLRRGGGQAALASYVAALREAAAIGPAAEADPAREAMAAMVAQRLGG